MDGPGTRWALSVTAEPLGEPASSLAWCSAAGFRAVQLSATQPGMRPRDLSSSARREVRALLGRLELAASGVDAWIPPSHLADAERVDRAVHAALAACEWAAELGRVPVCMDPGAEPSEDAARGRRAEAIAAIDAGAARVGIAMAWLGGVDAVGGANGICLDPAMELAAGRDPVVRVSASTGRLVAVRVVDLTRAGHRGPIGAAEHGRLDVLAFRVALSVSGFAGLPVVDARGWTEARAGALASAQSWGGAIPD